MDLIHFLLIEAQKAYSRLLNFPVYALGHPQAALPKIQIETPNNYEQLDLTLKPTLSPTVFQGTFHH
jgi:hypothetical protein